MDQEKYSKKQVERAGEKLRNGDLVSKKEEFSKVMDVLSYWRFSHEFPLECAFEILQEEVEKVERQPIYGKRLKRHISISTKLCRFEKMSLKNMQDIGGCRAVVSSMKKVRKIATALKKHPEFKLNKGGFKTKDYIKKPKDDGYRGYHIIGKFPDQDGGKKHIEIQLRTYIQHYWATAVEIVDTFTKQALKSNQGEKQWADFFAGASRMFSIMEEMPLFDSMSPQNRFIGFSRKLMQNKNAATDCKNLKKTMSKLGVIKRLEAYAASLQIMNQQIEGKSIAGYVVLVIKIKKDKGEVLSNVFTPKEAKVAEQRYLQYEKKYAGRENVIVAMVSTSAMGEIERAFPNYFADSTFFIALLQLIKVARV